MKRFSFLAVLFFLIVSSSISQNVQPGLSEINKGAVDCNPKDKNCGHFCCQNKTVKKVSTGGLKAVTIQFDPYPSQQDPHAPGAGVTECHNYNDKSKKIKADCPCWGQYSPDYEKCKPPSEEDKKCRNYCKRDFCKCKVKCQS